MTIIGNIKKRDKLLPSLKTDSSLAHLDKDFQKSNGDENSLKTTKTAIRPHGGGRQTMSIERTSFLTRKNL